MVMKGRPNTLGAIDDGLPLTEGLRLALEHAVAELGGVGGMIQVRRVGGLRGLRLVASSNLPPALIGPWERLADDGDWPPAHATREEARVWLLALPLDGPGLGTADSTGLAGGAAAVPVPGPDGPLGALTVLTSTTRQPDPEQWAFLEAVAAWAASRLSRPLTPAPLSPQDQPVAGRGLRQALKAVRVGSWEWRMSTGELVLDEAAMTVLGIDPETYDRRTETWLGFVHPDDVPLVTTGVDWDGK